LVKRWRNPHQIRYNVLYKEAVWNPLAFN
jgi:hypothetical protein